MISIIIGSVKPELSQALRENIDKTIDVPYELLIHDNRPTHWGLCKLYNHCARQSKGDILCFLHEDIHFHTQNWGHILTDFYAGNSQAGVVGFAGATLKTKTVSGWGTLREVERRNLLQSSHRNHPKRTVVNPHGEDFAQVLTLDGLALIVPKRVWEQYPFDEILFDGFHQYDIDFSLQVSRTYNNYVCYTIDVEHFSEGTFDHRWYQSALVLHQKWEQKIPQTIFPCTKSLVKKCEARASYMLARAELKHKWGHRHPSSIWWGQVKRCSLWDFFYAVKLVKYILRAL
jgi:hypothetical protein